VPADSTAERFPSPWRRAAGRQLREGLYDVVKYCRPLQELTGRSRYLLLMAKTAAPVLRISGRGGEDEETNFGIRNEGLVNLSVIMLVGW